MTTYYCKCGAIKSKSTNADNTGNRDTEHCQGCPYLLPWGEQEYIKGDGVQLKVKGYECRMSKDLEYASRIWVRVDDKTSGYVSSLDYEFLQRINDWIRDTYPNGELKGDFSRETIRPTDFSSNGRYRYPFYCSQNKAGMAAKAALLERFFYPDGSRKDMTPQEEEAKILKSIEDGKKAAQGACPGVTEAALAPAAKTALQEQPAPAFDYSGLDEQTATRLQNLERRALECRQRYALDMMEIVYEAHLELCGAVVARCDNGQFNQKEATFRAWCASIGVSKDTAYRLLQVQLLMDDSSPEEQEVLENAPVKLLYAAARPSAPAELVEQVKSGDITTHKQYQELLAELKAKDDALAEEKTARKTLEALRDQLLEETQQSNTKFEEAFAAAHRYHTERDQAEAQRNELIDRETAYISRIKELESRPIEVAVQPPSEEQLAAIRQQADEDARQKYYPLVEQAAAARKEVQARADALAAQLRQLKQDSRMPGIDTVYPMCRDYARSITTFQSTFLMVGAGLDKKEFEDCARELMDAAEELRCVLQATMDDRDRTTQKEDDLF